MKIGDEVRILSGPYRNAYARLVTEISKGWYAITLTPKAGIRVFLRLHEMKVVT